MAVIVMTWTPTTTSTISYVVRYAVFSPNPFYTYISTTETSITIPGLINGETYIVGVRSICDGGLYSEWSQQIVVVCDSTSPCHMEGTAIYNNQNVVIYGELYNWYAGADIRIAESGWHMPTNAEWNTLADSFPLTTYSPPSPEAEKVLNGGKYMKSADLWTPPTTQFSCTGSTLNIFNIKPSGIVGATGLSGLRYQFANFWCADEQTSSLGKYKNFSYDSCDMYRNIGYYNKHYGFSIRLVKDSAVGWVDGTKYTDYDGNEYIAKLMPDGKVWMTENLRVSRFNDGAVIPVDPSDWSTTIYGAIHSYI